MFLEEQRFASHWAELSQPVKALWRSQRGPLASVALTALPTSRATRIEHSAFGCVAVFACPFLSPSATADGHRLDKFGHHRAACSRVGKERLSIGVGPPLVCREAKGRAPSCPHRRGDGGSALQEARRRKEKTCPELAGDAGRARLVVFAAEVGGRWSEETTQFLRGLAKARADSVPSLLQGKVIAAWLRRWSSLLACSATRPFTESFLETRPVPRIGLCLRRMRC